MLVQNPILWLASQVIGLYTLVVIIYLVTGMLIQFGVVNGYNQLVRFIMDFGRAAVDPLLRPIQRVVPPLGSIDISPIILILGLRFALVTLGWLFAMIGLG